MFQHRRKPPSGLHQCPICHGDSVVPVDVDALEHGHWDLRLRCGQCGTFRDLVVSDDVANRYDIDLNRGMAEIEAALRRQERERMTAELRTFVAALEHDLIDAGDFASG